MKFIVGIHKLWSYGNIGISIIQRKVLSTCHAKLNMKYITEIYAKNSEDGTDILTCFICYKNTPTFYKYNLWKL